ESAPVEPVTAVQPADIFWNETRKWPSDRTAWEDELRSDTKLSAQDFRSEMIYMLAFVDDWAFHVSLSEASSDVCTAVRRAYAACLRRFVEQAACKPIPQDEWVGSLYLTLGEYPEPSVDDDPIRNLNDRFQLFIEAIRRGEDKSRSTGESLGKVFAGLCGT